MNGHKSSVYQAPNSLFTNQSSLRTCHKMTNCDQFRTKCCVKIAATLTLASKNFYFFVFCFYFVFLFFVFLFLFFVFLCLFVWFVLFLFCFVFVFCFFDKHVRRKLQQERILSRPILIFFPVGKWLEILWGQVIIIGNRRSLLYQ